MLTITRTEIRKVEDAGQAVVQLAMVTREGIVLNAFNNHVLATIPVTFKTGIDLDAQINAHAAVMFKAVTPAYNSPHKLWVINRNIITNGLGKLIVIIKTNELELEINDGFHVETKNDFYESIDEIL